MVTNEGELRGIISLVDLHSNTHSPGERIDTLIKREFVSIAMDQNLRTAIEIMANENLDVLVVTSGDRRNVVVGIISYRDIISAYSNRFSEHETANASISLKRRGLKILVHGQKLLTLVYRKNSVRKTQS